jgi:alkaline phosphatase D
MTAGEGMDRRTFLAGIIAAAAAGGLAACSSGDDGAEPGSTTTGQPLVPEELPSSGMSSTPFTLGIASGDPLPDSVILWTRLALDPVALDGQGGMSDDVSVRWELSDDDQFETLVQAGDASAAATLGHSVHVDVAGLEPDRRYHYRFRVGEHTSSTGLTRTAPASDAEVSELRFATASCQDFGVGHYIAHRAIAADDLDLVLFLGDYIYESGGGENDLRPVPGGKCLTLADYRNRYAHYKGDADLQAAHASCPWVITWDDHEVENNYAGLVSSTGAAPEAFAMQRAAAYQAFYEHQPLRLDPPTGPDWLIRRAFTWGQLARFFVLDGRQYRDDQPCDSPSDAAVNATTCDLEADDRTMLGAEQEGWLSDGLEAAEQTWKVLAQQTVMSSLVLGDTVLNVDQWDGYPLARRRLLDHIAAADISDVVVLSGDIHAAGAGVLRTDGTTGPETPVAVEFVTTSITSSGLAEAVGLDPRALDPSIFGITYAELIHRGYARCTVTPERWTTEFVIVADATDPDSTTSVAATVVTDAGTPALTVT